MTFELTFELESPEAANKRINKGVNLRKHEAQLSSLHDSKLGVLTPSDLVNDKHVHDHVPDMIAKILGCGPFGRQTQRSDQLQAAS
eukprot:9779628-Karenia_brevis.AAC.1